MHNVEPTGGGTRQYSGTQAEKTLAALAVVAEAVEKLRYGSILLTIHEGRVVQLDVTERQRFS